MAYNPNFQWKRKTVTITKGTDLPAGYQVKLTIVRSTDTPEAQADFRDLRFETTNGYGLSHWIESITAGTAIVWVKLKDALTLSSVDIYMYYGNPYTQSTSNGANTFIQYDGFENGAASGWTLGSGFGVINDVTHNSLYSLRTGTTGNLASIRTFATISDLVVVEASVKTDGYSRSIIYLAGGGDIFRFGMPTAGYFGYDVGYGYVDTGYAYSYGVWYTVKLEKISSNTVNLYIKTDSSEYTKVANEVTSNIQIDRFVAYSGHVGTVAYTYFDDFRIRKYVATEPATPTIGSTETVNWNPQRKKINITGTTPADYQIKLTVAHAMEMNVDYSDLRFVSDTNSSLSYWIESYTSNEAIVWVKIPAITTSGYIYMHYGNPNLTSASNGTNTFIQYHGAATTNFHDSVVTTIPFVYEAKAKRTSDSPGQIYFGVSDTQNSATGTCDAISIVPSVSDNTIYSSSRNSGTGNTTTSTPLWALNTFYRVKFVAISSSLIDFYTKDRTTYENSVTNPAAIPEASMGLNYYAYSGTGEQEFSFIRKYVASEPTITTDAAVAMNSFSHRKTLTINNTSGSPLTDYQVSVTVAQTQYMQPDFDDIRFVDSNNNLLPYWIESITGTNPNQTANVWIKTNISTGSNTVYMYYGNADLTSASDGANTFIQWHGSATSSFYDTPVTALPVIYEASISITAIEQGFGLMVDLTTANRVIIYTDAVGTRVERRIDSGGASASGGGAQWASGSYKVKIVATTTVATGTVTGGYSTAVLTTSMPTVNMGLGMVGSSCSQAWSFARKYAATEPTVTTGAEESITATTMTISPSETPCRIGICTVTVSVTWTSTVETTGFIPSIIVDSTKYSLDPVTLLAGANVIPFVVSDLSVGNHVICPDPN